MSVSVRALFWLTAKLMPVSHQPWLQAMHAELDHVEPDERVTFALGCCWAAAAARWRGAGTRTLASRIALASVGLVAALFHAGCCWHGIRVQ